jgi:hypothetical protein
MSFDPRIRALTDVVQAIWSRNPADARVDLRFADRSGGFDRAGYTSWYSELSSHSHLLAMMHREIMQASKTQPTTGAGRPAISRRPPER